jgi:hypothetical protein
MSMVLLKICERGIVTPPVGEKDTKSGKFTVARRPDLIDEMDIITFNNE